jgi:hypothetical protein
LVITRAHLLRVRPYGFHMTVVAKVKAWCVVVTWEVRRAQHASRKQRCVLCAVCMCRCVGFVLFLVAPCQVAVVDWAWTFSSPRLHVFPTSPASEEKASDDTANQDLLLAFGGYGLLTVYLVVVLWRPRDRVKSQAALALPAIVSVFMAVGSSFGLSAAFGVEYNPAVASLLFVLMGVGVDDAFVILEAYHASEVPYYDVVKRVGSSVGHSGAAILATTVTSLVAFATESNTVMPAIQAFAVYAVLGACACARAGGRVGWAGGAVVRG